MKIKTFGAKHFTAQLPRIEEGFKELGHQIVNENPDLIYSNDPTGFDEALKGQAEFRIFNVLDIPEHLFPNYDLEKLDSQLMQATHVTCISETTRKQLKRFLNIKGVTKIYQPAMPIFQKEGKPYDYEFLICGRNCDPNKRNGLAFACLSKYFPDAKVAVVGSEDCAFGDYFGVVSNKVLNDLYNSVFFVFSLTKYGGIELSQIEAILAGIFPIVCNDSSVAMEFNPEFAADPTPEAIAKKILEISQNSVKFMEIVARKQQAFQQWFDKVKVAERILKLIE